MPDRFKVYPKDKGKITSTGRHIVRDLQTGAEAFEGTKAQCLAEAAKRNK